MQYFQRKCPMHVSFVVYSHLQIPNILHILIKFENSYVLDKLIMKINIEKSQIWTPCEPPLPPVFYYSSDLTENF